ncbi:MAG: hypothetical protein Q7T49_00195 [bacterium]|nr:hypothetical protein [bacterium]
MINWAELFTTDKRARHHAFIVAGEPTEVLSQARDFLQTNLAVDPVEIYHWFQPHFKIDDSRVLKEHLSAPVLGGERFMLVGFENILSEAEQALLKILEEPPVGVVLIIATSRPLNLPATILSRVWLVNSESREAKSELLSGAPATRLNLVTKEVARTEREDESIESLAWPTLALAEQQLATQIKTGARGEVAELGEDLNLLRRLLTHKLAARSPKNILEYLTLIWPRL